MKQTGAPTETNVVDVAAIIESQGASWFQIAVVAWSSAVMFIEGYDMQVLAYAAPSIIREWHVSKALFGPVFGFGLFGYLLGATLLSNLADRLGRKGLIISGTLLFGALTLASAYAVSITQLIILRFIAGVGLGAAIPSTIALAAEYVPTRIRATTIAVLFLGYTGGGTAAGFIAAKIIPAYGWPGVFYLGGGVPVVVGLLLMWTLPESVRFLTLRQDGPARIRAIFARLHGKYRFDGSTRFVAREESRPGLPVQHLFTEGRARMTALLWTAFITSLLGHYFLTSWLPTVLMGAGISLGLAATATALLHAGGGIGGLLQGWLVDKCGPTATAIAYLVAAPLAILIASAHGSRFLLFAVVFLTGTALVGGQVALNALSGTCYPTFIRSTGTGWAFGVGRIGSIAGPVLGGVLMSMNVPTRMLLTTVAAAALACALATYLLGKTPAARTLRERSGS